MSVHRPNFWIRLALVCLVLGTGRMEASRQLPALRFAPNSGIEMKVTNFFEDLPPRGYLPVRVEVRNGSPRAREWKLQAMHAMGEMQSVTFATALSVPADSSRTFDLLIPLAYQPPTNSRFSNLTIVISGFGVVGGTTSEYSSGGGGRPTPYLGMGRSLALKHWGTLRDQYQKEKSQSLEGTSLDPALLPGDWRGWACFDAVIFSVGEWRSLNASARKALLDWVSQGGRLGVFYQTESPDLPVAGSHGAGTIETMQDDDDGTLGRIVAFLDASEETSQARLSGDYTWDWTAAAEVGRSTPPQAFIILFVVFFALVIGPVNFLVFAPAGQRHRLFWTTPLISLSASVLMGAGIVLSEGIGGVGQRIGVLWVESGERRLVLWQEQVSRTGVLVSSRFTSDPAGVLTPLSLRMPTANPFSFPLKASYGFTVEGQNGGIWSGDWFRSRTTQAQTLVAVAPTRERIEISAPTSGVLTALSSFSLALEDFWYFAPDGAVWSAAAISPGDRVDLAPASEEDFQAWWERSLARAGPLLKERAERLREAGSHGRFYARFPDQAAVPTLGSIRWSRADGILIGNPGR